jgi:predicted phosphodiesterase
MKWFWLLLGLLACKPAVLGQQVVVKPYIQPSYSKISPELDERLVVWFTDQTAGDFEVEYGAKGEPLKTVKPQRQPLFFAPAPTGARLAKVDRKLAAEEGDSLSETNSVDEPVPLIPERDQYYFKYVATLEKLPLNSEIQYRVKLRNQVVREATFSSRASLEQSIRFVMVGDLANGRDSQNEIAYQMNAARPQFMVLLGDIVYSAGRMSQYMNHFWPTYNQPTEEGPRTGAPLMASIPIYAVLGNHDAEEAKWPDYPDALAAYFLFYPGGEGPGLGAWNTPLGKTSAGSSAFRRAVGKAYPGLANYSFDYGPVHFLVLDSNSYVALTNVPLLRWIQSDLQNSKAPWKIVSFHAPAFHTSREHYFDQKMRRLEPIFERTGVDLVFSGHVHNYQRSKPLRFAPNLNQYLRTKNRVDGIFQIDEAFDGNSNTRPKGIIHIVSGGGGASLYSPNFEKTADYLRERFPGNWAPFTARYYATEHSFTLLEAAPRHLLLRQLNAKGEEVDRMLITKQ